jgi:Flp pilus assembly protein protease CpaA
MKISELKKFKIRTWVVLFLLFLGMAFLEVFRTQNWIATGYWMLIALMFLLLGGQDKAIVPNSKE